MARAWPVRCILLDAKGGRSSSRSPRFPMNDFTPLPSLLGGILIGLAATMLLAWNGRIAGISGIFGGVLLPKTGEVSWRALFLAGLVGGGFLLRAFHPGAFPAEASGSLPVIAIAGLLVGFGTRLGSGCTSGHGVCGLSRLSARSLVATLSFMATGALTVFVISKFFGGIR